jgi:hypothetical protein
VKAKKWATSSDDSRGDLQLHRSMRAAYDRALAAGRMVIWVDEGLGFGWQVYERL